MAQSKALRFVSVPRLFPARQPYIFDVRQPTMLDALAADEAKENALELVSEVLLPNVPNSGGVNQRSKS